MSAEFAWVGCGYAHDLIRRSADAVREEAKHCTWSPPLADVLEHMAKLTRTVSLVEAGDSDQDCSWEKAARESRSLRMAVEAFEKCLYSSRPPGGRIA